MMLNGSRNVDLKCLAIALSHDKMTRVETPVPDNKVLDDGYKHSMLREGFA